jgi:hypothetical protein
MDFFQLVKKYILEKYMQFFRKRFYLNGKLHREDGPAVIYPNGTKVWLLNDKLHREDGPAYIGSDGRQEWYLNGNIHREDGPAVIYPSGTQEWWLNDKEITENVTNWANERDIDLNNMSDEDKMILKTEIKMWK